MTDLTREGLVELADRVAEANVGETDHRLNEAVAVALGWHTRVVSGIGLNGRTPGRHMWFPERPAFGQKGRTKPPMLINTKRRETIQALRARAMEAGRG